MSFQVLQQKPKKDVVLVDLQYPYGKKKIYMNGSLLAVAAQIHAVGHRVKIVDLNIDSLTDSSVLESLSKAHVIGVSVVGSPYFPPAIGFCRYVAENFPHAKLILGGQVIRGLSHEEFCRIFGKRVQQVVVEDDYSQLLGQLPAVNEVSFQKLWEEMGDVRLRKYLEHEFPLFISQGCVFKCHFCAADKGRLEQHRRLDVFTQDLEFLMNKARHFGIEKLECYASSLDFFQNPKTVALYMREVATNSQKTGVSLKMRALCCMNTFLKASRTLPDFKELVRSSGLWCVGFGVDGPNEEVWRQQNKLQNDARDIVDCLNLCQDLKVRAEVLMIMGYPTNSLRQLLDTVLDSLRYARRWSNTILRPYLAKTLLPGNLGWDVQPATVEKLIANPTQFFNLDLCAFGSSVTHPRMMQRWMANLSYLAVILVLTPFGRCATSPLLPQGSRGLYGWVARKINRRMPFDR